MRFKDLCLIYEQNTRLTLVKGNFGKPLTANDYREGIERYINRYSKQGYSKMLFFLGKPNIPEKGFLNLYYHIVPSPEAPARSYQYTVPEATLRRFRTKGTEIYNNRNKAYFQPRNNVFYFNGAPLPKIFSENKLKQEMGILIQVNEFFKQNYGEQYSFLGDVYAMSAESTFSKIASTWERNKEDIRNLPKYFKDYFKNII